jgi:hypothetical protein
MTNEDRDLSTEMSLGNLRLPLTGDVVTVHRKGNVHDLHSAKVLLRYENGNHNDHFVGKCECGVPVFVYYDQWTAF